MKSGTFAVLAATLMLAACAHAAEPVATLNTQQIQTELTSISQQLTRIEATAREDRGRERSYRLMQTMLRRAIDPTGYDYSYRFEPSFVSMSPPRIKIEKLLTRRAQLQARLAELSRTES